MIVGDDRGEVTIRLFWKGAVFVISPQSCFDVADPDFSVVGGKACSKCSGRIALDQDEIRPDLLEQVFEFQQDLGCHPEKVLPGLHDVEIIIGSNLKYPKDLIEHLPVLCRDTDEGMKAVRI